MIIFSPGLVASKKAAVLTTTGVEGSIALPGAEVAGPEPAVVNGAPSESHDQVFVDTKGTRLRAVLAFSSMMSAAVVGFGLMVGLTTTALLAEQAPQPGSPDRGTTGPNSDFVQPIPSTAEVAVSAVHDRSGPPETLWFSDPETHWVLCFDSCTSSANSRR